MKTLVFPKKSIQRFLVVWSCISLIVLMFASYLLFIQKAVVKTAERTILERQITNLNMKVSTLESKYITLGQKVSGDQIDRFGLTEVLNPTFLPRTDMLEKFSFNVNEI